jgi:hypothetical protein
MMIHSVVPKNPKNGIKLDASPTIGLQVRESLSID